MKKSVKSSLWKKVIALGVTFLQSELVLKPMPAGRVNNFYVSNNIITDIININIIIIIITVIVIIIIIIIIIINNMY